VSGALEEATRKTDVGSAGRQDGGVAFVLQHLCSRLGSLHTAAQGDCSAGVVEMCEVGVVCQALELVEPDGEGVAAYGFAVEVVTTTSTEK
jgi:hypothetical protein